MDHPLTSSCPTDFPSSSAALAAGRKTVAFRRRGRYLRHMGRPLRIAEPGLVYHVLNRGNGRRTLFKDEDYRTFEHGILHEAHARTPVRLLAYCLMPNHWHFVLWPERARELSRSSAG